MNKEEKVDYTDEILSWGCLVLIIGLLIRLFSGMEEASDLDIAWCIFLIVLGCAGSVLFLLINRFGQLRKKYS